MASVAYWYADEPRPARASPPVCKRLAVKRDNVTGEWQQEQGDPVQSPRLRRSEEMDAVREQLRRRDA